MILSGFRPLNWSEDSSNRNQGGRALLNHRRSSAAWILRSVLQLSLAVCACGVGLSNWTPVFAQNAEDAQELPEPPPRLSNQASQLIEDFVGIGEELVVNPTRSRLMRTKRPVGRVSVTDPAVLEVVQYTPTEFELIGGRSGQTTLTLWFPGAPGAGDQILRFLVKVEPSDAAYERQEVEYGRLQRRINEMFPNSYVQLLPLADKLIVRGQARDAEEAAQILAVITGQSVNQQGQGIGPGSYVNLGTAARPLGAEDLPASSVINLLDVPGEMQVLLKVRVAELTRSAARNMGSDILLNFGDFSFVSLLGLDGATSVILNSNEALVTLDVLASNSYSKILAEPNLVTRSGQPASFISGGEFAVPTAVGVDGIGAATTTFRGFGTQLTFTPTVVDKDLIRMQVAPSFSTVNSDLTVAGIPGLNTRAVFTSVDLREGQWLAIAGLIQDEQAGSKVRTPFLGDIPFLDMFFSRKSIRRDETELIVLVSPELIHPMEWHQVPPILPGMEVTEPNDCAFYFAGRYEGNPYFHHRSTVYPIYQQRAEDEILAAAAAALRRTKMHRDYQASELYYIEGEHGFSP